MQRAEPELTIAAGQTERWRIVNASSARYVRLSLGGLPFQIIGTDGIVREGMVFTIEPGLYSSEVGGFRHSDTVLVTPDGIEILTDYPSDIESLSLPV